MIEEVINSIVSAEEKAEKIEKEAKQKAKDMILAAEQEAQDIIKEEEESIAFDIKKAEEDAQVIIEKNNKIILDKASKETLRMRDNCFEKMVKSKDIIIRGLLEKYGCR